MHERPFQTVQNKRLLMERKVRLIPTMAPEFGRELERRQWDNLASYPSPTNIAVVKDFYTNARTFRGASHEMYTSYVKGKRIRFDADTINSFLGAKWAGEHCQFALAVDEDVDYADVERTLCMAGGQFQTNRNNSPIHIRRSYLTPLAKYWMAFTQTYIQPCSHVSNIMTHRAIFLYCVLQGLNINVGLVIENEIKQCAQAISNKSPLGHPSLITQLCELAGVKTSTPLLERPRKEINASYYTQYCMLDEAGTPMPAPYPPKVHRRVPQQPQQDQQEQAQDVAPFQMRDMYMSLMESRMQALYRGEQALMMNLTSAFPERQFMSQEEFHASVAWRIDPAQASGGAGLDEEHLLMDAILTGFFFSFTIMHL
ncbi:hypothetical protein LR48_Vigan05g090100 [Vigna angularis]|uniref:Putative plant transposon protein domain-containing protein n=1 Tax=Phaseolus angularis TaxID=3914 RepID=A0A0L9UL45_PHAAN|nr:hypothetical protein LR48_Vigan05g090100 [Vigna angularis]